MASVDPYVGIQTETAPENIIQQHSNNDQYNSAGPSANFGGAPVQSGTVPTGGGIVGVAYNAGPPAGSRLLAYMQAQRQCASTSPLTCSASDSAGNVFSQMSINSPRRRVPSANAQSTTSASAGPLSPPVFQPGRAAHPSVSIGSALQQHPPNQMHSQQVKAQPMAMALRDNVANVPAQYQMLDSSSVSNMLTCAVPGANSMLHHNNLQQQQPAASQNCKLSPASQDYGGNGSVNGLGSRHSPQPPYGNVMTFQESVGGTVYFYPTPDDTTYTEQDGTEIRGQAQPPSTSAVLPNFTVYPGLPAHIARMRQKTYNSGYPSYFAPAEVKVELLTRQLEALSQVDPSNCADMPPKVDNYKLLAPIDSGKMGGGFFSPHQTSCYKALHTKDSLLYLLRRVHNFRMPSGKALAMLDTWKKMAHANVVHLRHVFQTNAFNDSCLFAFATLIFVYDYHATSETIRARHFDGASKNGPGADGTSRAGVTRSRPTLTAMHGGSSESLVWSYIIQLTSALRAIHSNGLAARTVDPTKVIVVGKNKVLINCCGMMDVVGNGSQNGQTCTSAQIAQQEDLFCLGRLVLSLCCNSLDAANAETINGSMLHLAQHYSADLKNLVTCLLSASAPPNRAKSVNDLMPMIGARFYAQLEAQQMRADMLENELCREIENGRLFRMATKLAMVCDRPEDGQWSETGDRYLVRLFRDHVFHAVNSDGKPVLDMAHIVQTLNKVDAGIPERVQLVSPDGRNVLVVSFADIRQCIEHCWAELNLMEQSAAAAAGSADQVAVLRTVKCEVES